MGFYDHSHENRLVHQVSEIDIDFVGYFQYGMKSFVFMFYNAFITIKSLFP